MKKKWWLWVILVSIFLLVGCSSPGATTTKENPVSIPTSQLPYSSQTVELNYAMHESVTHQLIKDTIAAAFNRDIELEKKTELPANAREYQLRDITIENKNINVFLELHFQPISKAWLKKDAYSWLWEASVVGLDVDGKFVGNPYSTGYDISIIETTPLVDGRVIYWGTAKLNNSGKPFDDNTVTREQIWIDGPGMKTLN
jgi:hypothetical protein